MVMFPSEIDLEESETLSDSYDEDEFCTIESATQSQSLYCKGESNRKGILLFPKTQDVSLQRSSNSQIEKMTNYTDTIHNTTLYTHIYKRYYTVCDQSSPSQSSQQTSLSHKHES